MYINVPRDNYRVDEFSVIWALNFLNIYFMTKKEIFFANSAKILLQFDKIILRTYYPTEDNRYIIIVIVVEKNV